MSLYTQILKTGVSKNPEGVAFICDQEQYSYKCVEQRVICLAEKLEEFGVEKNSKVIIKVKNPLKFSYAILAIAYLEAIPVPVYSGIAEEKLTIMCEEYQINYVFSSTEPKGMTYSNKLELENIGIIYRLCGHIDNSLEGVSLLLSTSGTTSRPKAIMLTEDNIRSNVEGISEYLKLNMDDHILLIKDLSHSSSIVGELFVGLFNGCQIVFTTKLCREVTMLTLMQQHEISVFFAVPTLLKELMVYDKLGDYNLSKLRIINFYGSSMNSDDIMKLIDKFGGTNIIYSYGQTEASPRVTYIEKNMIISHLGSSGRPIRDVKISIIDERGCECPPYVKGEIVVQGPNVMRGYYMDEKKTEQVLKEGKLYTGDIAYLDKDGFLFVTGRKDNMFIRSGKNIYPEEIENVLLSHPSVLEAIVVPVRRTNDAVDILAYIVKKDDNELVISNLLKLCKKRLEDYKIPKEIIVVSELEKTPSGKIKRNQF